MSNFYRVYSNGEKMDILLNANDISEALYLLHMCFDGNYASNIRIVRAEEHTITIEEIRCCAILSTAKDGE